MRKLYVVLAISIFFAGGLIAQVSDPLFYNGYDTVSFEDLNLEPDSYWNGSDESGGFTSGGLFFVNHYNPEYFSWDGWAYSNTADDTTAGFMNQYSAITASGFEPEISGGPNYALSWVPTNWMTGETIPVTILVEDDEPREFAGFYVTNSTWAALSMEYGDDYARKFGGESGDDPDWFKLSVWGYNNGTASNDTVEFYLADYRFANNNDDYIVKTWEWLDLSVLGEVDSLKFDLWSTDVGLYGMNTPAYFCVDNFYLIPENVSVEENQTGPECNVMVYPNPSNGVFKIKTRYNGNLTVEVFDPTGTMVYSENTCLLDHEIDISAYPSGFYIIKVNNKILKHLVLN